MRHPFWCLIKRICSKLSVNELHKYFFVDSSLLAYYIFTDLRNLCSNIHYDTSTYVFTNKMQAIIMAAGLGSRFGIYTEDRPKGFIEVGGVSMIERSVRTLIQCGIKRIVIGTGYMKEAFEKLASDYMDEFPGVTILTCHSPRYAETNSMYTLYNMRHLIEGDYLLLESDLVFEKKAIELLISNKYPDIMLTTPVNKFQDQYYVEYDKEGWLRNCSVNKTEVETNSELVGIHKISKAFSDILLEEYDRIVDEKPKLGYEFALLDTARHFRKMYVLDVPGLLWYEIDDPADKRYAEENIIPKIE